MAWYVASLNVHFLRIHYLMIAILDEPDQAYKMLGMSIAVRYKIPS